MPVPLTRHPVVVLRPSVLSIHEHVDMRSIRISCTKSNTQPKQQVVGEILKYNRIIVIDSSRATMSSLPPALDFSATEEEICGRWVKEGTFKAQDRLSCERGDEVIQLHGAFLGGDYICSCLLLLLLLLTHIFLFLCFAPPPPGVYILRWTTICDWSASLRSHSGWHHQGHCHTLRMHVWQVRRTPSWMGLSWSTG
jgi:hypothetical protein